MPERYIENYPDVLTPDEVRHILGVGRNAVYDLLKSGDLQSIKIGKLYRISKAYLMEYLGQPCYNQDVLEHGSDCTKERRAK